MLNRRIPGKYISSCERHLHTGYFMLYTSMSSTSESVIINDVNKYKFQNTSKAKDNWTWPLLPRPKPKRRTSFVVKVNAIKELGFPDVKAKTKAKDTSFMAKADDTPDFCCATLLRRHFVRSDGGELIPRQIINK